MAVRLKHYLALPLTDTVWWMFLRGSIGLTIIFAILNVGINWWQIIGSATSLVTYAQFVQWSLVPTAIGLFTLATIVVVVSTNPQLSSVRLYAFFTLAMTYFLLSQPEFIESQLDSINLVTMWAGLILMPPLFFHFLLYFPFKRRIIHRWPFLLPLVYLPVLPIMVSIPSLNQPINSTATSQFLNFYLLTYLLAGLFLLLHALSVGNSTARKRALTLLIGTALPLCLLGININLATSPVIIYPDFLYLALARYSWWCLPLSIGFAFLRFNIVKSRWLNQYEFFMIGLIGGALALSFLLLKLAGSMPFGISRLTTNNYEMIIFAIMVFYGGRFLWRRWQQWQADHRLRYRLEDFKTNVRILSRELLQVKSRRELESLISWNLATDFNLQSAEISSRNISSSPYALGLPLKVHNIPLGTLFLGPKITGQTFSPEEQLIFAETQQQIALALLSIELDETIQVTEALTQLKSKFLANATHELRTPLNSIINYIGFVRDEPETLNQVQVTYLDQALQGSEKLLDLINNILDMSKIEAGQMALLRHPVDLREVATEIIPVVNTMIGQKPIKMVADIAPTMPIITGDRLRLRQIMLNVLSNAVRFTQAGQIYMNVYPENGSIIIKVTDTGEGIEEAILPVIFDQFITKDLIDTGRASGSGLGLAITKSLVELHHGRIEVESRVQSGTTFIVNLPIKNGDN